MRSLLPPLSKKAWIVLGGNALSSLGSGLVLPFLIVYLREVRDIPVETAGLIIATIAVVGLAGGPIGGSLVDRIGSRKMLIVSLFLCTAGSLLTAEAHVAWQAFGAAALFGAGISILWPATLAMLASIVAEHERPGAYALHYASLNLGIGIGGVIGGTLADVSRPETFELMYRLDALSWFAFAVILLVLKDVGGPREVPEGEEAGGYRHVVSDRVFVALLGIMTLFIIVAFAQLNSGFVAYARNSGVSTWAIGIAFAANTTTIVVLQLVALRMLQGRRRTRALQAMFGLVAVAWTLTIFSAHVGGSLLRASGFALALSVFALGECVMSPTVPGLVNDLAPDHLRGRYNASYSLVFSIGHIIGPMLSGFLLGASLGDEMFVGMIAVCAVAAYLVRKLEPRIPEGKNLPPVREPDASASLVT